ncbi:MAG TPA: hypothetical protein VI365_18835, partial [Trebonia sp.]
MTAELTCGARDPPICSLWAGNAAYPSAAHNLTHLGASTFGDGRPGHVERSVLSVHSCAALRVGKGTGDRKSKELL